MNNNTWMSILRHDNAERQPAMKVGDLVKFKGENRTGIILKEYITDAGNNEYSVRWFPSNLGKSRVVENLLEPLSFSGSDQTEEEILE